MTGFTVESCQSSAEQTHPGALKETKEKQVEKGENIQRKGY